jgi:WD40 repeat protein
VTFDGHTKWVAAVAFSPDGKWLATASADRTVRVWRVEDRRCVEVLKGHTDTVCTVALTADAILSAGHDGTVRLWRNKREPQVIEKRRGAILSIAVSPDSKTAAAGGVDGIITLLDLSAGKERARLTGHKTWVNSLAFSADGTRLASGSSDGTARLWDVKANNPLKTFTLSDPREIRGVALSPDGKTLAAGVRYGKVQVWEVATGKVTASLDGHDGDAWSVCFTPDGKSPVSGGGDWGNPGSVKLWTTWKARATLAVPSEVLCVAVSPDGRWLAAGGADRAVRLWDLGPLK